MVPIVTVALLSASVGAQTPDPHAILQDSAAAMATLRTAVYDARLEVTGASAQRVVTGRVTVERITGTTDAFLAAKFAVQGEVSRGTGDADKFEVVFDGHTVRRFQSRTGTVLQGDPGHGGEGLLQGTYGALILRELVAARPLAAELAAAEISYGGLGEVDGFPADIVEVRLEPDGAVSRWYIDAGDRLPRRLERSIRSANNKEVEWVLTLGKLQANPAIDPATFRIAAPEAARVQVMSQPPAKGLEIGDMAPDWTLKDADGREHKLSDYRGKLVVLDFWASWCPHCKEAMPAMQKLHERYAARGVAILGVNCREKGPIDAGAFARGKGCTYPELIDPNGETAPKYRVKGIPALFVVGPDGRILHVDAGYNQAKEKALVQIIERNLAG